MSTMPDRAFAIYFARVLITEASRRRHSSVNRNFYWTLIAQAQKSRRKAAEMLRNPVQEGLFA